MIQNRDKKGTISFILNFPPPFIILCSVRRSIDAKISPKIRKNRGKWRHVKSREDRCSEPLIIQNPIGGLHNSETISLVFTGLYGSYGFVVTMVVAEW